MRTFRYFCHTSTVAAREGRIEGPPPYSHPSLRSSRRHRALGRHSRDAAPAPCRLAAGEFPARHPPDGRAGPRWPRSSVVLADAPSPVGQALRSRSQDGRQGTEPAPPLAVGPAPAGPCRTRPATGTRTDAPSDVSPGPGGRGSGPAGRFPVAGVPSGTRGGFLLRPSCVGVRTPLIATNFSRDF